MSIEPYNSHVTDALDFNHSKRLSTCQHALIGPRELRANIPSMTFN